MGWFDEQLKLRKERDRENIEDAFLGIAGAVAGKRLASALKKTEIARSAIEEVLSYYKIDKKTDDEPTKFASVDDQLEYYFRPHGIMRREVMLREGWYKSASGAMLGTLKEDGSVVALIPGAVSGYTFCDHRTGKRIRVNKKTAELIDNEAMCFYKPFPMRKLKVGDLLGFMRDQLTLSDIFLYIGALALTTVIGLMAPVFTKWLFGSVLESGSTKVLVALAVFMLGFSLCNFFVQLFKSLILSRIELKQDVAVEAAVMSRMISLPTGFFRDFASGELSQLTVYIKTFFEVILTAVVDTGFTALFSLIYIGQIFTFAPSLVLPSVIITLASIAVSLITALANMKVSTKLMGYESKERGMSYATIKGIQKIKLAGAEKRMFSRWARLYAKEADVEYNPPLFITLSDTIILAVTMIGSLILYSIAVKSGVSVADYYAFNASYAMVSGAFVSLSAIATTIASLKSIYGMVKPIFEAEPEITDGKKVVTSLKGAIEMSNVTFRYDEHSALILDNLSLKIQPGEYVAIVGKTGCGKSTILRLLLGFEKAQKGAVYYDGNDINTLDLQSLRKNIGVVMQDGKLFQGEIFSNIVIAAPELTLDDAWEAAELASIADDIRKMPMGMNTLIAEGQSGISGGQRQRLMIARAIASKPKVLLFDEATSALDNVTQKKVSDAIDSLRCTRIVIAHRLSTIKNCDRIIVLDGGKIVESGNYDELIEKNGFFSELVKRQRLEIDED